MPYVSSYSFTQIFIKNMMTIYNLPLRSVCEEYENTKVIIALKTVHMLSVD